MASRIQSIRAGIAVLASAHVEPLGLEIRPCGEWALYQFVALPGHPRPGNATNGYSHPSDLAAWTKSKARIGRDEVRSIKLRTDHQLIAYARRVAASIWGGCPVKIDIVRHQSDGGLSEIVIRRRIVDQVRLVQAALEHGHEQVRLMRKGATL